MNTLVSYKNDPKLKKVFIGEIVKHRKADQIIKRTYGKMNGQWRGCAVGCSVHSLNIILKKDYPTERHSVYETELGIPELLARLEDTIFEGLPQKECLTWPERFAKAVPVGVDLTPVKWKFCAFILKENIDRVLTLKIEDSLKKQVVDAIQGVLKLHERAIEAGEWDASAARSAAWSAESAARSAAWSAESAARSAAWSAESAAWSAESAARSAAWSAAWSAERSAESAARSADSAAWSAAYSKYANKLLELLRKCK